MLTELNAFGVPFFPHPPLSHSILVTRTWDDGDPKQKSLFSESPLLSLKTGHSSEPYMKFVIFYFLLARGHVGASPCSKRLFFQARFKSRVIHRKVGKCGFELLQAGEETEPYLPQLG